MTLTNESPAAVTCPHFNPMIPAYQTDPYPIFAELRRDTPVFYSPQYGLWVVTRYADVATVLKQTDVFSSVGSLQSNVERPASVRAFLAEHGLADAPLMVESDAPVHTRMRRVINKAFTPQRINLLEPQVRAITDALIDAFVADGEAEFVSQFALPLPGRVICDLFGVPHEDFAQIKRWSDEWLELLMAASPEERLLECARSTVAFQEYFLAQIRDRQQNPRDDLMTVMLPAELGGTADLTVAEAAYNALDFVVAGYETTTNVLGNALMQLFAHPQQLATLREHPEHIPHAVEELLRVDTSVMGMFRVTTRASELGGVPIPANARVWVLYSAANHDTEQFSQPEQLDITRANAREHMALGKGIHTCIGAPLARLELRIALERLLERLPNLRPAEGKPAQRMEHFWLRGYASLPIAWDAVR
ncbi:MAG TPA: cytochrome P450 [Roseiflexaceae bacterium]|nr:cytochrome P450 [Roseiflexaceae bacterium]